MLQERVESASMISSPSWLEKESVPDQVPSPPRGEQAQEPEQVLEEDETSSPAAKDHISSSSIGIFPLLGDADPRPTPDLADEDLSLRLSGPSTSGIVQPTALNPISVHQNAAPNHPDSVHYQSDPLQLDTLHQNAENSTDTLLLLPPTNPPSRDLGDVKESRSRGIKARKL